MTERPKPEQQMQSSATGEPDADGATSGDGASPASAPDLHALRDAMRAFAAEREWQRFHTPKNLAMALSIEAAELMEHFQWLTAEESARLDEATRARVAEELADVLLYLVRLADRVDVDLGAAARAKLVRNAEKYPVEKARGSARKYTEY